MEQTSIERKDFMAWAGFYLREWGAPPIPMSEGKVPAVAWKEYQSRLPPEDELRAWFEEGRPYGMAVVCGKIAGNLFILDIDAPAEYVELNHTLPGTQAIFSTPRGGYGVVLRGQVDAPKRSAAPNGPTHERQGPGPGCVLHLLKGPCLRGGIVASARNYLMEV